MADRWRIVTGDLLRGRDAIDLGSEPFDAVLCDPPYELNFMSKGWDRSGVAFSQEMWSWIKSHLRPGAPLLAFGGTRTYHRMTCAIEDAGFEIRDSVGFAWVYVSGFPKSHDVSKALDKKAGAVREVIGSKKGTHAVHESGVGGRAVGIKQQAVDVDVTKAATPIAQAWEGWGTALKPAWEPVCLGRVPLDGTMAENVEQHGVGGLGIDACRVGIDAMPVTQSDGTTLGPIVAMAARRTGQVQVGVAIGRWPANLVLAHDARCERIGTAKVKGASGWSQTGSGPSGIGNGGNAYGARDGVDAHTDANGMETVEQWDCVPGCPARTLDEQSGNRPGMSGGGSHSPNYAGGMFGSIDSPHLARSDGGGISRMFYCAKVSTSERNDGLDDLPELTGGEMTDRKEGSAGLKSPRAGRGAGTGALRDGGRGNAVYKNPHPTMKPVDLTEYLARLILPPRGIGRPRRLLVPFAGVASEMVGALRAGWDEVVGIELSEEYAKIARLRLTRMSTSHQLDLIEIARPLAVAPTEKLEAPSAQPELFK